MRAKILLLFLIINVSSQNVFSAYLDSSNYDFSSFWGFYSSNRFSVKASGRGYTGIAVEDGLSNAVINPASLKMSDKNQICFEYVFRKNEKWIADSTSLKQLHPAMYTGLGFNIRDKKDIQAGFIISSDSSYRLDTGGGDYINCRATSLLVPVMYERKSVQFRIKKREFDIKVKMGLNLIYSHYTLKQKNGSNTARVNFSKVYPKFGFIIYPDSSKDNFSFGFTYMPKRRKIIKKIWTVVDDETFDTNVFPTTIGIGVNYKFVLLPISLAVDFNHSGDSKVEGLDNRNDFNIGADYTVNNDMTLRAGVFSQEDYRKGEKNSLGQIFMTLGGSYKYRSYTLNLALMQGIFVQGVINQTYLNLGLSYDF